MDVCNECFECFDKYASILKRSGVRICVEIYRCNRRGESINFGQLYDDFDSLVSESELSNLLMLMNKHKIIKDEWKLEDNIWKKNIYITDEHRPDLHVISENFW